MVKNKRDSILRINYFSDTESEEDNEENAEDESMETSKNQETEKSENTIDFEVVNETESDEEEDPEPNNKNGQVKQKIVKPKKVGLKKTGKKGIIYISQIPKHMNVTLIRELFENFGEVGRVYLQPDNKSKGENQRFL